MSENRNHEPAGIWEQLVALLGLLLVLGSLGYLLFEAIAGDHSAPDIVVEQHAIHDNGSDFLVEFTAQNRGGRTAAGVQVTGTLTREGRELERAETVIDYVPTGLGQRGGLYFRNDPRQGELALSASGYQEP